MTGLPNGDGEPIRSADVLREGMTSEQQGVLDHVHADLFEGQAEPEEVADFSRTLATAAELLMGEGGPEPRPDFLSELQARAKEMDVNPQRTPTPNPPPARAGGSRKRRLTMWAGAVVATVAVTLGIVWATLRSISGGPPVVSDPPAELPQGDWEPFVNTADPVAAVRRISVLIGAPAVTREGAAEVRDDAVFDEQRSTAVQKQFARMVKAAKVPRLTITVNNTTIDAPEEQTEYGVTELPGYEPGPGGFNTFRYRVSAVAQKMGETLLTVDDPDVYPGVPLDADYFMTHGKVKRVVMPNNLQAPVKLGVRGLPADRRTPDKAGVVDVKDLRWQPLAAGADDFVLTEPKSGQKYDELRGRMIADAGTVSQFLETTAFTYSSAHLQYQVGASAGGWLGSISGTVQGTEDEEKASVYMLLVQPSYRVYVDNPPVAADWVKSDARPEDVAEVEKALNGVSLGYIDQVTYGRVILVLASSTSSTRSKKDELHASTGFFFDAKTDAERVEKSRSLDMNFRILVHGGRTPPGMPKPTEVVDFARMSKFLSEMTTAPFDPKDALPIQYGVKFLADHSRAKWVGVHSLRSYLKATVPYQYQVFLNRYKIKNSFDDVLTRGNETGDFRLAVSHGMNKPGGDGNPLWLTFDAGGGDYDHRNDTFRRLVDHEGYAEVPASQFRLKVCQSEEDDKRIDGWHSMNSDHNAWGEQAVDIDIQKMLSGVTPGQKFVERKLEFTEAGKNSFPGKNELYLTFRLLVPDLPKLRVPDKPPISTGADQK